VCSTNGEKRNACKLLIGKEERYGPVERPKHRWVHNIEMDFGERGQCCMYVIGLAQDSGQRRALVNTLVNLRVPWNAGKFSSGVTIGGHSSSKLHRV
jgi:hypothetical protein